MLSPEDARRFAVHWIDSWNQRNLARVVSHYRHDCEFTSPRAAQVVGQAVVVGREALHDYWERSLRARKHLEFRLDHMVWDEAQQRLVIVYWNTGDTGTYRAIEMIDFDNEGNVRRGEALYGAIVPQAPGAAARS